MNAHTDTSTHLSSWEPSVILMPSSTFPLPPAHEEHLYDPTQPPIDSFSGQWRFLSNFFPAHLTLHGIDWPSSEHAFNGLKSLDQQDRLFVAAAPNPRVAKQRGQKVTLRPNWDTEARYQVMDEVLNAKFTANSRRISALLSTGSALLVEGNTWHDNHWGDCRCQRPSCAPLGENHLGRALMRLRYRLQG